MRTRTQKILCIQLLLLGQPQKTRRIKSFLSDRLNSSQLFKVIYKASCCSITILKAILCFALYILVALEFDKLSRA